MGVINTNPIRVFGFLLISLFYTFLFVMKTDNYTQECCIIKSTNTYVDTIIKNYRMLEKVYFTIK